jgi:hypothetical protein
MNAMFKKSVIFQSGQSWKLLAAIMILLSGSFAPLFPTLGISWTAGTVLAFAGYGFGLISIRCAKCHSMWFWEAAKDPGLYGPLFKNSTCPVCEQ